MEDNRADLTWEEVRTEHIIQEKNTNELGLQRKFKARLYKIKSKKTAGDLGVV